MNEYIKPEVEVVEFVTECIANTGVGSDLDDGDL